MILALFSWPGGSEWLVVLIVGLLLFGRRLPEIARSFGSSIVEFKKGLREVRDDPAVRSTREELKSQPLRQLDHPEDRSDQ